MVYWENCRLFLGGYIELLWVFLVPEDYLVTLDCDSCKSYFETDFFVSLSLGS